MKTSPRSGAEMGFTIIEVLLVLAVSGMILTSAVLLFNGRQAQTEFKVAANQIQTQIQSTINDAGNGYNPTSSVSAGGGLGYNFICNGQTLGVQPTFTQNGLLSPPTPQGTNGSSTIGCVYLGRVLVFSKASQTVNIYSVVGNQYTAGVSPQPITSGVTDSYPILLADNGSWPFLPKPASYSLEYGSYVECIEVPTASPYNFVSSNCSPGSTNYSSIAFIIGGGATSSDGSVSASSFIPLAAPSFSTSAPLRSQVASIDTVLLGLTTSPSSVTINPPGGVYICLSDSSGKRSALISIGVNNQEPVVDMVMHTSSGVCG
jgi:type II secretory pathway pseudopilin PulG